MNTPTEAEMQYFKNRLEVRGSSLYWKVRGSNRIDMSKPAGAKDKHGYLRICVNTQGSRRHWLAHRIVWLLHHGVWPIQMLDHKDRDPSNNNPENLRLATSALNTQNSKVYSTNTTGIKGVCKKGHGYEARIIIGKTKHTKYFPTLQQAIAHRKYLEEKFHPFAPSQQIVV